MREADARVGFFIVQDVHDQIVELQAAPIDQFNDLLGAEQVRDLQEHIQVVHGFEQLLLEQLNIRREVEKNYSLIFIYIRWRIT